MLRSRSFWGLVQGSGSSKMRARKFASVIGELGLVDGLAREQHFRIENEYLHVGPAWRAHPIEDAVHVERAGRLQIADLGQSSFA